MIPKLSGKWAILISLLVVIVRGAFDVPISCTFSSPRFCDGSKFVQGGKEQQVSARLTGNQALYDSNGN